MFIDSSEVSQHVTALWRAMSMMLPKLNVTSRTMWIELQGHAGVASVQKRVSGVCPDRRGQNVDRTWTFWRLKTCWNPRAKSPAPQAVRRITC